MAMEWLLVNGYFDDAQLHKTPRVSDPRSTASARRAPERMRCPGACCPTCRPVTMAQEKTRGAGRCRFRSWTLAETRGCDSMRDSPPSSTVGCCWWSCAWCHPSSRCAGSLSSAGNVCWAKPNHAFFHCQQSSAPAFAQRARIAAHARRGHALCGRARGESGCAPRARMPGCKQATARPAAHARITIRGGRAIDVVIFCPRRRPAARGNECVAHAPRERCLSQCTSRFARKMRGRFPLQVHARGAFRAKKNPRRRHRGLGCPAGRACQCASSSSSA